MNISVLCFFVSTNFKPIQKLTIFTIKIVNKNCYEATNNYNRITVRMALPVITV